MKVIQRQISQLILIGLTLVIHLTIYTITKQRLDEMYCLGLMVISVIMFFYGIWVFSIAYQRCLALVKINDQLNH